MFYFLSCIPFVIVLLSIAVMPLIAHKFWHRNMSKCLFLLVAASVIINFIHFSYADIQHMLHHAMIQEYIPFVCTISALYIISNNIRINMRCPDSTVANTIFLFCGGFLSSIVGTTGASMLLIRPFLAINKNRPNKALLVIFFILIVSNIGGLLTPLGDPPLFVGYLNGVDFFWTVKHLFTSWIFYITMVLIIFYTIDTIQVKKYKYLVNKCKTKIDVSGLHNLLSLFIVIGSIFINNFYLKNCITLFAIALSIFMSAKLNQQKSNKINYEPIKEVLVVFFAIFITISPVMHILQASKTNISDVISNMSKHVRISDVYYWLCGCISSVLDNAPSYLLFFNIAGDADSLMHNTPNILRAISTSAVVMGSLTYIGNAPNMMIRSVVETEDVKMPSFFSYMAIACAIIIPVGILINVLLGFIHCG